MCKRLFIPVLIFLAFNVSAATVDTVSIYSKAMNKEFKCVVIKPLMIGFGNPPVRLPVVYVLHGYGGWYSNWIIRVPDLIRYADEYKLMIVCPDGGVSSWYFDSPIDSTMKYETYISKEVPEYIDAHYPTIKDRKGRAITGLSMGGHGGLFLAFRHADIFGACGSMSGGVDLNYSRNKYDIMKRIGDTIQFAGNWKKYIVSTVIENYPKDSLAITFDCGTEDFYYEANHKLHEKMLKLKIPHDYTERPGKHDWAYWRNSIQYHLLFFRNYFDKMNPVQ
ncbi:MAG: esterase family protein [Chitinophagaceae bacterium]|nr:esterase family protein [Chitinophagaceae bacterium]